jgi:hypothetical protein
MAVSSRLAASISALSLAVAVLSATSDAIAQKVCTSTDGQGNVSYYDCPKPSTYGTERPGHRPPTAEEGRSMASAVKRLHEFFTAPPSLPAAPVAATVAAPPRPSYAFAGGPLLITGMLVAFVAGISFVVAAFRVSLWWGLSCVFLSPVGLVFLVKHWRVARMSFFASLAGIAAALVGFVLVGGS